MNRRNWTREELVAALSLYCQLPFGKMHSTTREVQTLAERLHRTPAAVALKLANFASFDPEHRERGVKGMQNTSKLDQEIWDEFYGDWALLAEPGEADFDGGARFSDIETDRETTVVVRRGQSFFRRAVLSAYGNQCCITQIRDPSLLRASHIIPWSFDVKTRLNPSNGLALNSLHDSAFDQGLITLDEGFRVVLSRLLHDRMPNDVFENFFRRYEGNSILRSERFAPPSEFVEHHRENIFRDAV